MNLDKRYFPSKVLLFGEYGILLGAKALAMPYDGFKGSLVNSDTGNKSFLELYQYIKKAVSMLVYKIDLERLYLDLKAGLSFDSTIPLGSGLGSSGALVAALYKEFGIGLPENERDSLPAIQKDLATIESFYHGQSSGIDPLVSFVNKPMIYEKPGSLSVMDSLPLANEQYRFFLVESGLSGKTSALVERFMGKLEDANFKALFQKAYAQFSDKAIDFLTQGRFSEVYSFTQALSVFQLENMSELIPQRLVKFFKLGLETDEFALKICGSGGGGYFLGMARSSCELDNVFEGMHVHKLE